MKQVGIAEFKAHLSKYLRDAKAGEEIRITDRGVPVARLSPERRNGASGQGTGDLRGFKPLPPLDLGGIDIVELLLETRQNWR